MQTKFYVMAKRKYKISVIQLNLNDVAENNLKKCISWVRDAASQGAEVILLPELYSSHYFCQSEDVDNFALAEPLYSTSFIAFSELAKELGVVIIVPFFEKRMAGICKLDIPTVQKQLQQLAAMGIIEYLPQKETPQIHFLVNRAPAAFLHIDQDQYHARKEAFTTRINTLINFAIHPGSCRSVFIGNYFGDTDTSSCGICDYCLAHKKSKLENAAFSSIEQQLYTLLTKSPSPIDQLLMTLGKEKEEGFHRIDLIEALLPVYFEIFEKLETENVTYIQLDEPFLALNLTDKERNVFTNKDLLLKIRTTYGKKGL